MRLDRAFSGRLAALSTLVLAIVNLTGCPAPSGGGSKPPPAGGAGGAGVAGAGGGSAGAGGSGGSGGCAPTDAGAGGTAGMNPGGQSGRDGGTAPPPTPMAPPAASATPYCDKWRATAMVPGGLPGFATDSECLDFAEIPAGDVPCTGRTGGSATIAELYLAQTHLLAPSSANITMNDRGEPLVEKAIRPEFRVVSHRPTLLKVGLTGDGASPEVKVTGRRAGTELGSLCLRGPATMTAARTPGHRFEDSFTVTLPAAWMRPGLELEVTAGTAKRAIPATELRVVGGVRHQVVDMPVQIPGDPRTYPLTKFTARYGSMLPVQSLTWSRFPVPVVFDPLVLPPTSSKPARLLVDRALYDFDELGEFLDVGLIIQRANAQNGDTSYYANGGPKYGGGLGLVGGNTASGSNGRAIFRHELGHTYGLNHLEPLYDAKEYPYLRNREGKGGGVGPFWAFMQSERYFFSPFDDLDPMLFKRDAMAGGDGPDNFHGHFTVQVITDYMQNRIFWDDDQKAYVRFNPATGEFGPEPPRDENWYFRAIQRDLPIYTIWGYYSADVKEANVIQPPLHYRGNLMRVMDPTNDTHLEWLRAHPNVLCTGGCDFIFRVTYEGGTTRTYLHNRTSSAFSRWAMNVPAEGRLVKVQVYRRVLKNDTTAPTAPEHVSQTTGATIMEAATLVAERTF